MTNVTITVGGCAGTGKSTFMTAIGNSLRDTVDTLNLTSLDGNLDLINVQKSFDQRIQYIIDNGITVSVSPSTDTVESRKHVLVTVEADDEETEKTLTAYIESLLNSMYDNGVVDDTPPSFADVSVNIVEKQLQRMSAS